MPNLPSNEFYAHNDKTNDFVEVYKYFKWRQEKAKVFCERFPEGIKFENKTVLDLGCGNGSLSFYALEKGAKLVVGIDVNNTIIDFSNFLLEQHFSQYKNRVSFLKANICDLESVKFDIIICQATFEHILDPYSCLKGIELSLKQEGKAYIGFADLYNSPWGDHKRTKAPFFNIFPWAHICFKQEWLIKNYNKNNPNNPINSIHDLGLNGFSFSQFLNLFNSTDLKIIYFKVNNHKNPLVYIINIFRVIPGLRELLSMNIYITFKKENNEIQNRL